MRVEGQLALEDGRRYEHDTRTTVGREPAGEIERVLRLLPVEQGHHDGAIRDRAGPARKAASAVVQQVDVGKLHLMSW
jgi:hypothetical protein